MAELGETADPKALIEGDPDAVFENARVLDARSRDATAAADQLRRIDTGAWQGAASDKFREDHQTEVPRWSDAGESLENAALALTDFANCLAWAQGQAAEAIAQWEKGENATREAKAQHDRAVADADARTRANAQNGDPTVVQAPAFQDPGEASRQAARDMLARARQQLAGEGDRCAQAIRAEAELAPQDSQKQADANFFGGIWDSVKGAGESLYNLLSDPAETVAAMADNIAHPVETFKQMVAWDDWAAGRGDRALGKVTGEILVGLATGGAGRLLHKHGGGEHGEPKPDGHGSPAEPPAPVSKPIYPPTRRRVTLRKSTELAVFRDAPRTPDGQGFECEASGKIIPAQHNPDGSLTKVNPDTGKPDPSGMTVPEKGKFDIGHRPGQEWWRYKLEAEAGGYDRQRVIEDQNDPSRYRIEDRQANQSHRYELPP